MSLRLACRVLIPLSKAKKKRSEAENAERERKQVRKKICLDSAGRLVNCAAAPTCLLSRPLSSSNATKWLSFQSRVSLGARILRSALNYE